LIRKELFTEKPLLEEFLKLHENACNLIRENPLEAASIISDAVKVVDSSFVIKVFRISPKYCASLPKTYIDSTMKFVAVLNQLGYIKNDLAEEDIFDLSTIHKIHPEPDHYNKPGKIKT
jgi:NitT/TauT family transport system substrate-binding protein